MDLSELTSYAEERYQIQEQRKWEGIPGFSVLTDPKTGKWVALLMRQWDSDSGTEIQKCDLKCGQQTLSELPEPYLSVPFRMTGQKWVGVSFDSRTDPEVVFRLFDRAVSSGEQRGYTIVLHDAPVEQSFVYEDTALPPPEDPLPDEEETHIPAKIVEMVRLYRYEGNSFVQRCRNFYLQGKFMENYEDDVPWNGTYKRYFPTYHDLNLPQLRGYFTWRTHVRKGEFLPIPTSLAYLYVYELLNGIGASSPEDVLQKLRYFEAGFLDSKVGDSRMRSNLHRWMLEYAVLHHVPADQVRQFVNPSVIKRDDALSSLRCPETAEDDDVFSALAAFSGDKLEQSIVLKKDAQKGRHLFAAVWRAALALSRENGKDLFAACFGKQREFPWYPLANAVYWEEYPHADEEYVLDACRSYRCRGGVWKEARYERLYFRLEKLRALLHETDRRLRKFLKTGHYLHEKPEEAWAAPYVEAALEAERRAEREAAKPKISIDLSHLDQIRRDSLHTRDSLLTEEERGETEIDAVREPAEVPVVPKEAIAETVPEPAEKPETGNTVSGLDTVHAQILRALLRGESAKPYLEKGRLMASVVADTINDWSFDEIGDAILDCDGSSLSLVEEYREDVLERLGGQSR